MKKGDGGVVKKWIAVMAVLIIGVLTSFSLNQEVFAAPGDRATLRSDQVESSVWKQGFYRPYINYTGSLNIHSTSNPAHEVEEVQYTVTATGVDKNYGWKTLSPDKNGNYNINAKIYNSKNFLTERTYVRVWVKYKDGHVEDYYSPPYILSDDKVKHVREHAKGVEVNDNTYMDEKYEFVPQWGEKTYLEIVQPNNIPYSYTNGFKGEKRNMRGTRFVYHNVGSYKGQDITLEATLTDYKEVEGFPDSDRSLAYGINNIHINTIGYVYTEHRWRFIDSRTGQPVKVNGYFTFTDIDALQGLEFLSSTMNNVRNVYVERNSTVKMADTAHGSTYIITPFWGNTQSTDTKGWFTITLDNASEMNFRWTWNETNHKGTGFIGYVGDTLAKVDTHKPEQYILGRNNNLEVRYVRTNPPQPIMTYVTDHTVKNKSGGKVDSYQISQDIPSDLGIEEMKVKNTSGTDISDKFNIKREGNKVVAKAKSNSISSLRGEKVRLEVVTKVKDLESKLDENGEGELRYIVEGEVKEGSTTKNAGIATGVLIYDKDQPEEDPEDPEKDPEIDPEPDPDPEIPEPEKEYPDQVGGTYTGRHVNSETGERKAPNDRGYLSPGQSYTLRSKNNIYGHRYSGRLYYKGVGERFSTSQTVRKLELTESEIISGVSSPLDKHEVWFYYDYINIPYEVEYRNAKTGTKIHPSNAGEVNVDNPYIARPVDVEGYNYTGRYDFNNISTRGYATLVQYEEGRSRHKIVYYYELEDPDNTHKDFDEYDSMEAYTNVGLVTKRDEPSDAIVGHNKKEFGEDVLVTKVNANTTAVLDKYKAPIAIEPVELRLEVKDSNNSTSEIVGNTTGQTILNTDYVDGLRIQKTIGYGKGNSTTKLNIVGRNGYLDMEEGVMKSVDQARKEALGASGSTIDTDSEETGYYGRWLGVSQDVIDLEGWTPTNSLSANVEHEMTDAALDKVTSTIDYKVHNILKHNYEVKTTTEYNSESGKYELVEYYEYKDTDILEGFYRGGRLQDSGLEFETEVDISGIKVGEMLNAKGFNVNNNKLSTTKHLVAREKFTTNGTKYTGHETLSQSRGNGNYNDLVESDRDGKTGEVYLDKELDYYEEFGYMPYSVSEEDLMTQQAVPVGGKITYINPYDYFVLPSAIDNSDTKRGSAIDSSSHELGETLNKSKTIDKVSRNVGSIKRNGLYTSVMPYNKTNSGFYSESVDEFDEFGIEGIGTDKDSMKQGLGSPYSPVRVDTGYTHQNLELSDGSVLEYKQPIRFDGEKSQVRLRNRVLVGRMTGYPVIIDAQEELDIEEAHSGVNRKEEFTKRYADIYEEAYEREFGYKPTKYDKALSGNGEMTWYYLPLEKENIRKNDEFATRLVVNGIGTSQFNLVEDHSYGFEKFLYGRGDDVIYSGERESFESFEEESGTGQDDDKLQIIGQEKESEKTDQINGVRTRNNSEINKKLLEE